MIKFKLVSTLVAIAALTVVALPSQVSAIAGNTNTAACNLNPVVPIVYHADTKTFDTNKNFTYNENGTVTGKFKVDGTDVNCKKDVVFASWNSPTKTGYPLKDQTLYKYSSGSFGKGVHTLTVKLPTCSYWQIDLLEGRQPTGDDGTADYGFMKAHMLDTHTAGEPCKPVTPPVVTPPVTPPATPTTPAPTVTALPSTGADAASVLAGTTGLSTTAGLAINLFKKRKLVR